MLSNDFCWLATDCGRKESLPSASDREAWFQLIIGVTKKRWAAIIKRTQKRVALRSRLLRTADIATKQLHRKLQLLGAEVDDETPQHFKLFACEHCGRDDFFSYQALCRHVSSDHGLLAEQNFYVHNTRCRSCMKVFPDRNEALRHIVLTKCMHKAKALLIPSHWSKLDYIQPDNDSVIVQCGCVLPDAPADAALDYDRILDVQAESGVCKSDPYKNPSTYSNHDAMWPPAIRSICCRPIIVLHLFAGRRRPHDIQHEVELAFARVGKDVLVLSIDMVHGARGDMADPVQVNFWRGHMRAGHIYAVISGPPCETWSIARYQSPDDGPGPVRSIDEPWAISTFSIRQMLQCEIANRLLFVALDLGVEVYAVGGCGVTEHPAMIQWHELHHAPSTWRLPLTQGMLSLPGVHLHTFDQGMYGAASLKPTSMLAVNLSHFGEKLRSRFRRPTVPFKPLHGKDASGRHRTYAAKEYPQGVCRVVAESLATEAADRNFNLNPDTAIDLGSVREFAVDLIQGDVDTRAECAGVCDSEYVYPFDLR